MHDLRNAASDETAHETELAVSNRARALALDIMHRIRPVCAHMPDGELLALSTHMAVVELRYFEQATVSSAPRRRAANA